MQKKKFCRPRYISDEMGKKFFISIFEAVWPEVHRIPDSLITTTTSTFTRIYSHSRLVLQVTLLQHILYGRVMNLNTGGTQGCRKGPTRPGEASNDF